jgi:hypothetical protein
METRGVIRAENINQGIYVETESSEFNSMANPPAIYCAENIALLSVLHTVPAQPSANPIHRASIKRTGYTLSLDRERSLSSVLAFLSCTKDDSYHIPAVCIEEGKNKEFLNVLLAVNKNGHDAGNQVLDKLKRDFEKIFSALARVPNGRTWLSLCLSHPIRLR